MHNVRVLPCETRRVHSAEDVDDTNVVGLLDVPKEDEHELGLW